ncbi:hypothetical protein KB973_002415 [Vibrio parahaemolyticus]|uniref:hypothetical protein n=1 Tax=Vibrio parahaemolyticus TaxID=670 RepID=UPI001124604F|nr:hypothetical protein [Vibrio parahaemolyticus]EHK0033463.1 hypothetical protein [Vibrio parahaemolyticus]TOQ86049.1 hypothetical protein CGG87_17500 [Vibrio parahaemolyticus]
MDAIPPPSLPAFLGQEESLVLLRERFSTELEKQGYSTEKGKTIDEYASAFSDLNTAPASPKALQKLVGGDFGRVSIAFKILRKATKPTPIVRNKALWFVDSEQRLISALQAEMSIVWQAFDGEVQQLVSAHTQESLKQIDELEKENKELVEFIDELQKQIRQTDSQSQKCNELENKLAQSEQVASDYRSRIDHQQQKLDTLLLVNQELVVERARAKMLDEHIASLIRDKERLQEHNTKLIESLTSSHPDWYFGDLSDADPSLSKEFHVDDSVEN